MSKSELVGEVDLAIGLLLGGLVAVALAFCIGIAMQEKPVVHSDVVRGFEIVSANKSGKSSRVVLRDLASGRTTDALSIGSCNREDVERIKIGSKWDVHVVTYVLPKAQEYYIRHEGLNAICPRNWK